MQFISRFFRNLIADTLAHIASMAIASWWRGSVEPRILDHFESKRRNPIGFAATI